MATSKFIPKPHGLDKEFFQLAISSGQVHLQRCKTCAHFQHPPRYLCGSCGSLDLGFVPVSGNGEVYSWTVSHFTTDPGWVEDLPYATVVVELAEGPRLVGAYTGLPADLDLGQAVHVRPEPKTDDFAFLWVDP